MCARCSDFSGMSRGCRIHPPNHAANLMKYTLLIWRWSVAWDIQSLNLLKWNYHHRFIYQLGPCDADSIVIVCFCKFIEWTKLKMFMIWCAIARIMCFSTFNMILITLKDCVWIKTSMISLLSYQCVRTNCTDWLILTVLLGLEQFEILLKNINMYEFQTFLLLFKRITVSNHTVQSSSRMVRLVVYRTHFFFNRIHFLSKWFKYNKKATISALYSRTLTSINSNIRIHLRMVYNYCAKIIHFSWLRN